MVRFSLIQPLIKIIINIMYSYSIIYLYTKPRVKYFWTRTKDFSAFGDETESTVWDDMHMDIRQPVIIYFPFILLTLSRPYMNSCDRKRSPSARFWMDTFL